MRRAMGMVIAAVLAAGCACWRGPAARGAPAGPAASAKELVSANQQPNRAAEKRLLAEALLVAWKEVPTGVRNWSRSHLLMPLAAVAPDEAVRLYEALPAAERVLPEAGMFAGMLVSDPARALAWAKQGGLSFRTLARGIRWLAGRDPAKARDLFAILVAQSRAAPPEQKDSFTPAAIAAAARIVGDPQAADLAAQAREAAMAAAPDLTAGNADERWYSVAWSMALFDAAGARGMLVQIADEGKRRERSFLTVPQLARTSPADGLAVLETYRPKSGDAAAWFHWSRAARDVVAALAARDPVAATALARRLPKSQDVADMLALIARSAPPEKAAALCREALECARQVDQNPAAAMAAVAEAMPPGSEQRAACVAALSLTGGDDIQAIATFAHVGYVLSASDPKLAAALLEDALANIRRQYLVIGGDSQGRQSVPLITALAAADPARALAVARRLPEDEYGTSYRALSAVAQAVALLPQERARLHWQDWLIGTDWVVGEERSW